MNINSQASLVPTSILKKNLDKSAGRSILANLEDLASIETLHKDL